MESFSLKNFIRTIFLKLKRFSDYFYHPFLGWIDEHKYFSDNKGTISRRELRLYLRKLKKGDIMLSYTPSYTSSIIIPGEWTHAFVYIGRGKILDASGKGVSKRKLIEISNLSRGSLLTGIVAFRPNFNRAERKKFFKFLNSKMGIPYDYGYTGAEDYCYCSGLVGDALKNLGYEISDKIHIDKFIDGYKPILMPQNLFNYMDKNPEFKQVLLIKKEGFTD